MCVCVCACVCVCVCVCVCFSGIFWKVYKLNFSNQFGIFYQEVYHIICRKNIWTKRLVFRWCFPLSRLHERFVWSLYETDPGGLSLRTFIGTSHTTWWWLWLVQQLYIAPHSSSTKGCWPQWPFWYFYNFLHNIQQLCTCKGYPISTVLAGFWAASSPPMGVGWDYGAVTWLMTDHVIKDGLFWKRYIFLFQTILM